MRSSAGGEQGGFNVPFTRFLLALRSGGLKVSMQEWLGFLEALVTGLVQESLTDLYFIGRATLVKHEGDWTGTDEVFLHVVQSGAEKPSTGVE